MRTIFDFTQDELNRADKFLFAIFKRHQHSREKYISLKHKKYKDINDIKALLNEDHWFTYNEETNGEKVCYITPKTERIIQLYGGLSLYIANQKFQTESLRIAQESFKASTRQNKKTSHYNRIALLISSGSLLAFVAFQIWDILASS